MNTNENKPNDKAKHNVTVIGWTEKELIIKCDKGRQWGDKDTYTIPIEYVIKDRSKQQDEK